MANIRTLFVGNYFWMLLEQFARIFSTYFVTIYIARSLGPGLFGQISYALAVFAVLSAVNRLGFDATLVKDLSRKSHLTDHYISNAIAISIAFSILTITISLLLFLPSDGNAVFVAIIIISVIFQALNPIEYYFQSIDGARYVLIAKTFPLLFFSSMRLCAVYFNYNFLFIAYSYLIEYFLNALLLHHAFKKRGHKIKFNKIRILIIKKLLRRAASMSVTSITSILLMRTDQILISNIMGSASLGMYSAATKFYEGWILLIYTLSLAFFPKMVRLHKASIVDFEAFLVRFIRLSMYSTITFSFLIFGFSDNLINIVYGRKFSESSTTLAILAAALPFAVLGTVSARYLNILEMERFLAFRTSTGLIFNVFFNYLFITKFGIAGAAIALTTSLFLSNLVLLLTNKNGRRLLILCKSAIIK